MRAAELSQPQSSPIPEALPNVQLVALQVNKHGHTLKSMSSWEFPAVLSVLALQALLAKQ